MTTVQPAVAKKKPRQRKRDWPQRVYKFAVLDAEIPESIWALARSMQTLWNTLCVRHEELRNHINENIATITDAARAALWIEFRGWAREQMAAADLGWECGPDVLDRFEAACRRASKAKKEGFTDIGWPHPGGLRVSLPHRYTAGGAPLIKLSSSRASRLRFSSDLQYTQTEGKRGKRQLQTLSLGTAVTDDDLIIAQVMQHRPIPAEAIVKSVRWVGRRTVAFGWEWSVCIQVEEPHGPPRVPTGFTAAIDIGWRKFPDHVRVGYLVDDQGEHEELQLPLQIGGVKSKRFNRRHKHKPDYYVMPETYDQLRALQSLRDAGLEAAKTRMQELIGAPLPSQVLMRRGALCRILSELGALAGGKIVVTQRDGTETPVRDELQALPVQVRSDLAAALSAWLDRDKQMLRTETAARVHAVNRRKAVYGEYARRLTQRYDVIYVELMSFKDIVEGHKSDISEQRAVSDKANRYHQASAAAEFLMMLKSAARNTGCEIVRRKAAMSTRRHHVCGHDMTTGPQLMLHCDVCNVRIDQDENAAKNLLSGQWPAADPEDGRTKRRRRKPKPDTPPEAAPGGQ